ncbi:MAG: hypothetical protein K9I94_06015 [Bacteroidales bacterium]|nr:hypothetical protein [Bacteroidales bacterium]
MIRYLVPGLALVIIIGVLGCQKPRNNQTHQVEKPDLSDYEIIDTVHIRLSPNRTEYIKTIDSNLVYEVYTITSEVDPERATQVFHAVDTTGQENFAGRLYLVYEARYDDTGQINETYSAQFPLYILGNYSMKFLFEGGGMGSASLHIYIHRQKE